MNDFLDQPARRRRYTKRTAKRKVGAAVGELNQTVVSLINALDPDARLDCDASPEVIAFAVRRLARGHVRSRLLKLEERFIRMEALR